jgi:ent-copalyl diphosphate synthase
MWAADRLHRLGISRYFRPEINECVNYVYRYIYIIVIKKKKNQNLLLINCGIKKFRYWTDEGICWARNSKVYDVDDTAMGFRLLRLHGHKVSAGIIIN